MASEPTARRGCGRSPDRRQRPPCTRSASVSAPWLFVTFIGGLLSAFIIGFYQESLVEFSTIILFIPFVIGLSGNVAIQGATVIVRGMATGDIQPDNIKRVVRSELAVGLINGVIFGVLAQLM